jgi:hypothetical protein
MAMTHLMRRARSHEMRRGQGSLSPVGSLPWVQPGLTEPVGTRPETVGTGRAGFESQPVQIQILNLNSKK